MHVLLHSTLSLSIYRKSQKHAAAYEQVSKQAWVETKKHFDLFILHRMKI
jgi:hypothetical protein